LRRRLILPWSQSLSEFLTTSRLSDPSAGPASLRFPVPTTTSRWVAPCGAGCHAHPGSALRLSQPRSGFQASLCFAALFRAAAVPGTSLQRFPLARIAHPSRGRLLPCSHPPALSDEPSESLLPPVSPTPTLARSCLVPLTTMGSLSTRRNALPGPPGTRATEPPRPASFICFEALFPSRIRSHQPELPRPGRRSSPGFSPL